MPVAKFGALPKGRANAKDSSHKWSDRGNDRGPGSIGAQPRMPSDQPGAILIPVEVYGGLLIVAKGHIDSSSGLNFLIDTGQTYASVDRAIADKLGLDGRDRAMPAS